MIQETSTQKTPTTVRHRLKGDSEMDGGHTSPMLKQFTGIGLSPNVITNSESHVP